MASRRSREKACSQCERALNAGSYDQRDAMQEASDKVESGRQTVAALNPECEVEVISYQMDYDELRDVVASVALDIISAPSGQAVSRSVAPTAAARAGGRRGRRLRRTAVARAHG